MRSIKKYIKENNLVTEDLSDTDKEAVQKFEKNKKQYFLVPNDDGTKTVERLASNSIKKYTDAVLKVKPQMYRLYTDIKDLYDDILEKDYPIILSYSTAVERIMKIAGRGRLFVNGAGRTVASQLEDELKSLVKTIAELKTRGLWK